MMADVFMFAAQPKSDMNEVGKEKPPNSGNNAKRARSHEVEEGISLRKPMAESFKSKLLSASSPDTPDAKNFSKPSKDNIIEKGTKKYGKGAKKNTQQSGSMQ
ncbi:hypothetical protein LWI28_018219 [Acer negundo]|uniref:Uncharacterized protein n=1 Tax=Acer negundo TaxID=4023 RepID=A0AAD5IUP5_ACENE|nr:hypothetical protein LWI28_018219 [Acer negundo]